MPDRYPTREALVAGNRRCSYAQLREAVRASRKACMRLACASGDKIAILMGNTLE